MIRSVARRFSSWPAIGSRRLSGGPMTQEGGLHAETPTAGRRGAALGSCDSAEAVDSFSWMGRYTPTSAHRKAPRS